MFLNIKKICGKKLQFIIVAAILAIGGFFVYNFAFAGGGGGVFITPASGGTNVSIDTTSASTTPAWQTLSGPTINETTPGSIHVGTHTFNLPAGWEFNTGSTVTVVRTVGDIEPESQSAVLTANTLTFEITQASTENSGLAFIMSSMQVRPTGTEPSTDNNMTYSGTAGIAGIENNVTSFGTLSTVAGVPTQLKIETQADGNGTAVEAQNLASGAS